MHCTALRCTAAESGESKAKQSSREGLEWLPSGNESWKEKGFWTLTFFLKDKALFKIGHFRSKYKEHGWNKTRPELKYWVKKLGIFDLFNGGMRAGRRGSFSLIFADEHKLKVVLRLGANQNGKFCSLKWNVLINTLNSILPSTNWKVLLHCSGKWNGWSGSGRGGGEEIWSWMVCICKLFTPPTSQNPKIFPSSTAPKINRLGINFTNCRFWFSSTKCVGTPKKYKKGNLGKVTCI